MALVTTKQLLLDAQEKGYAVGAFNVENMEMVQAVVSAAEELQSPVIMQTTPSTVKYADLAYFYANAKVAAEEASVPVAIHLDHGNSFELAMQALRAGYTSIMIDGSHDSFEENIKVSKAVADACHPSGVPVEAELGKVGGKEDDLEGGEGNPYTDPMEAKQFVEETKIDALACSFGTTHGIYLAKPQLDFDVVKNVRAQTGNIPVVMHGGSGVSKEDFHTGIKAGVRKVNYFTYMDKSGGNAAAEYVNSLKENEPKFYSSVVLAATEAMKENVKEAMRTFALLDE